MSVVAGGTSRGHWECEVEHPGVVRVLKTPAHRRLSLKTGPVPFDGLGCPSV